MHAIRRFRVALLLLALVVAIGVAGYVLIEKWDAFDALYMTIITIAGVGFMEVHPLSGPGRTFTLILIVGGFTVNAYIAWVFVDLILVGALREALGRRRMERELGHLQDHTIICGYGRMGQEIALQFAARKAPFVVIEVNQSRCEQLAEKGLLFVHGDASDDQILRAAGVERAASLITVAPRDADNIFITLSARALNPKLLIVARSIDQQDARKLELAGADRAISPYLIGARRIAAAIFQPAVVDYLDLQREDLEFELRDFVVEAGSHLSGKRIRDVKIRHATGCTVLAIREAGTSRFKSNPRSDTEMNVGDTLIVVGTAAQIEKLQALGG